MGIAWQDGEVWTHAVSSEVTLRGRWFDQPGKPILHFMHGNGFCGGMYWPLLAQLAEHYALFLHDVQGHGDSDNGEAFPGFEVTTERVIAVIQAQSERFAGREVIGIGHSFGAICSFLTAAKPNNPFSSLVLLDPVFFSRRIIRLYNWTERLGLGRFNPLSRQAKTRGNAWENRNAAWAYFHQRGIFKGWTDEALNAYLDHALQQAADGSLSLKCPPWMEAAIFSIVPKNLWAAVEQIRIPCTIYHGDKSYGFIAPSLAEAQRMNPLIHTQQLSGGHCFMQEQPEQAAELVLACLAKRQNSKKA